MVSLRQGEYNDAASLSQLIYAAEPTLLTYMFGAENAALQFLVQAAALDDGQYSARNHHVAASDDVIGCLTLWESDLSQRYIDFTIESIKRLCTTEQLIHIAQCNRHIEPLFAPPKDNELSIGHVSVEPNWRGQGIGMKLIAYAIRQAKLKSKSRLVIDVDEANEAAVGLYERCDFMAQSRQTLDLTGQTYVRMHYVID